MRVNKEPINNSPESSEITIVIDLDHLHLVFLKNSKELIQLFMSEGSGDCFLYKDKVKAIASLALILTLWKDSPIQITGQIQ